MAIIKHRIMSRGRIAAIMIADRFGDDFTRYSREDRRQAERDMFFHLLADGKDVKVYHDTDLGGLTVEYNDGNN